VASLSSLAERALGGLRSLLPSERREDGDGIERPALAASLCVVTSFLIWTLLTLSNPQTAQINVPTEVIGLPRGEALVSAPPRQVRATFEGQGFDLLPLFTSRPAIPIQAVDRRVDLEAQIVDLPAGVEVRSVSPSVVVLETGPSATVRVPVRPKLDLSFRSTFALSGAVEIAPDSVSVTGAAEVVRGLTHWPVEPLPPFENLRDTVRVAAALSDTLAPLVTLSAETAELVIPVGAFTGAEREVEVQVVGAPSNERLVALDPPTVQLRFRTLLSQYDLATTTPSLRAVVTYEEIRADNTNFVTPRLVVPDGLVVRDLVMTPAVVGYFTVTIAD
jgi:hypothetical protein